LQLASCTVDLDRSEVRRGDERITLTEIEHKLLAYLAANSDRTLSQQDLLREVWGYRGGARSATVKTTISRLRKKIEAKPSTPNHLLTVRGGYRFEGGSAGQLEAGEDGFIGREPELAALSAAFEQGSLVVLVGPPGAGKSRLASRWASRQKAAWRADLVDAASRQDLLKRLAADMGISLAGVRTLDDAAGSVRRALAGRGGVVVLDGADRCLDEVSAFVLGLQVKCLVTSRQRLGVSGERVVEVGPLSGADAKRLFVARAIAVRPDFDTADANLDAVLESLDRLPLAIELAAARVNSLSLGDLHSRLEKRFRLLSSGSTSLRGAISLSWELLSEKERVAAGWLAMFRGGFGLDAAERLLGADGLDHVLALRDRSLLTFSGNRYGMYESVRLFALDSLTDSDEAASAHAQEAVGIGERLLHGVEFVGGLAKLAVERENLAAVVSRADGVGPELATRAALILNALQSRTGPMEGRQERMTEALRDGISAALRTRVHINLAELYLVHGHVERASELLRAETTPVLTDAIHLERTRGHAAFYAGDFAAAEGHYVRGVELARQSSDAIALATVLANLGVLLSSRSRVVASESASREALAVARRAGAVLTEGIVLSNLATLCHEDNRPEEATRLYREAIAAHSAVENPRSLAITLGNLANLLSERGEADQADEVYLRALDLAREVGNVSREGSVLQSQAFATFLRGDLVAAEGVASRAVEAVRAGGIQHDLVTALALHCGVHAGLGRLEVARRSMAEALEIAAGLTSARFAEILAVWRGCIEVAEARAALAEGRESDAASLVRAAIGRKHDAENNESWKSNASLRASVRGLDAALASVGAQGVAEEDEAAVADLRSPAE